MDIFKMASWRFIVKRMDFFYFLLEFEFDSILKANLFFVTIKYEPLSTAILI